MNNLAINIGSGHICLTSKQLTIWIYTVTGSACMTLKALRHVKKTNTLPDFFKPQKDTQAARTLLANSINICAARNEGKTGRHIGTSAIAANWNVSNA